MVERLKDAIQKARERREAGADLDREPRRPIGQTLVTQTSGLWDRLVPMAVDPEILKRERIVSATRTDSSYAAFDILRTRLLKVCRDNNWIKVGIVSPTKGCGKSLISANLAFSAARQKDMRIVLLDLDLRAPRLTSMMGAKGDFAMHAFLRGETSVTEMLRRIDNNLAVGFNTNIYGHSAEILQSQSASRAMDNLVGSLHPNVVLVDLPPILLVDDAIGFLPNLDAVLLVAAAGHTTAKEIDECERTIVGATQFLGVVLNKCEGLGSDPYHSTYELE